MAEIQSTFAVSGLDSDRDAVRVVEGLEDVDGIMGATVDRERGEVEVRLDQDLISEERARSEIRDLGYEIE